MLPLSPKGIPSIKRSLLYLGAHTRAHTGSEQCEQPVATDEWSACVASAAADSIDMQRIRMPNGGHRLQKRGTQRKEGRCANHQLVPVCLPWILV